MTKFKRLLWGVDKEPDLRDVVALICALAVFGFYFQHFAFGKELVNGNIITAASIAGVSIFSKNPLLKSKKNGV